MKAISTFFSCSEIQRQTKIGPLGNTHLKVALFPISYHNTLALDWRQEGRGHNLKAHFELALKEITSLYHNFSLNNKTVKSIDFWAVWAHLTRVSIPADKARLTFYGAKEEEERAEGWEQERRMEGEERKEMVGWPLTKHSAWDMAFTESSQMPWQLIRALNASCINTPCTWSWVPLCTQINTHTHSLTWKNIFTILCLDIRNTEWTECCGFF